MIAQETPEQKIERMERDGLLDPTCAGCVEHYRAIREGRIAFAPSHKAMSSCQSGGRPHCTCDTCF